MIVIVKVIVHVSVQFSSRFALFATRRADFRFPHLATHTDSRLIQVLQVFLFFVHSVKLGRPFFNWFDLIV